MNGVAASFMLVDPGAILDRHAVRRAAGVPTVSVLVGPIGAGGRTWRRWAAEKGRSVVVASGRLFPCTEWAHAAAAEVDLPAAAVRCLAQRAGRESGELLAEWRAKTPADRERFWDALAPNADDDLIGAVASLPLDPGSRSAAAELVRGLGERIVPAIAAIAPSPRWPSILFVAGGIDELLSVSSGMAEWVMRMPGLPVAVAVPTIVWDEYVNSAIESRTKALLKQGELVIPGIQAATVEQRLAEAGVGGVLPRQSARAGWMRSSWIRLSPPLKQPPPHRRPKRKTIAPAAQPSGFSSPSWSLCPKLRADSSSMGSSTACSVAARPR